MGTKPPSAEDSTMSPSLAEPGSSTLGDVVTDNSATVRRLFSSSLGLVKSVFTVFLDAFGKEWCVCSRAEGAQLKVKVCFVLCCSKLANRRHFTGKVEESLQLRGLYMIVPFVFVPKRGLVSRILPLFVT